MATVDVPTDAKIEAGRKAFRKFYPRLSPALISNNVPEHLFAEGLIEESVFEIYASFTKTSTEKRLAVAAAVQQTIRIDPKSMKLLCSILDSQPSEHIKKLSKEVKCEL